MGGQVCAATGGCRAAASPPKPEGPASVEGAAAAPSPPDADSRGSGSGRMQRNPRGGFPGPMPGPGGIPGAEGQMDEDQPTGEDGSIGAYQDGSALVLKLDLKNLK